MTYTQHRDTQETLTVLDTLDLDTEKPSDEEIAARIDLGGSGGSSLCGAYRPRRQPGPTARVRPRQRAASGPPGSH